MATEYRRKISLGFAFLLITSIFIAGLSGTAQRIDAAGGTRADSLPVLNDTTVLPDTIMMGDLVNFTVLYTDADDDPGEVRVRFERLNGSRGITDSSNPKMNFPEGGNYSQGVEYYYVKAFDMPGTYRYVFNVTDVELNETVVENGTEFQVILPVPDEGTLSGRVTTGRGNDTAPRPDPESFSGCS